ncbi:cysteine desulfurase family protein [Antiquaquibacter soli]|uniref:cysteine desulfurase n=1 Tax=Antiquaquibacter soli TaxID=3064523 RepID=A0ABT9BMD2_9MICO|nr:cysteine desulfurase family protein [Protaetiibacter sp. WY-16]MDO7882168.1 cysteine desulfurase family protein [Protaetiibacter sp. WY-16]
MIYLDQAATSATRREVLEAMWPYLTGDFGNPSSHHAVGESAARGLADARSRVAAVLGVRASEVVFTSGGTEADNLAVKGIVLASRRGRHIVTSAIEHPAVLESCDYLARHHGADVTVLPVGSDGLVDPDRFAASLRDDTALATIMYANNEVGTVQPVEELARAARERGIPFHTDAVQAAGWLPLALDTLGVDALSISGHKLGAPKGIGALAVRARVPLEAVLHGGGQERERRSGTENVAGAVGLATALELAGAADVPRIAALRDDFIAEVLASVPGAMLTGSATHRLPGHASFCFPGTSGESVLLGLEARGITCSSGSACAAGSDEPSDVLLALGIPAEVAQTAVRFTFGDDITREQLATTAEELRVAVASVRSLG